MVREMRAFALIPLRHQKSSGELCNSRFQETRPYIQNDPAKPSEAVWSVHFLYGFLRSCEL